LKLSAFKGAAGAVGCTSDS